MINKVSFSTPISFGYRKSSVVQQPYLNLQPQSDCVQFSPSARQKIQESCVLERGIAKDEVKILNKASDEYEKYSDLVKFLQASSINKVVMDGKEFDFDLKEGKLDVSVNGKTDTKVLLRSASNKIGYIINGYSDSEDGSVKAKEIFGFEDGQLSTYVQGFTSKPNSDEISERIYSFKDGKLRSVAVGVNEAYSGEISVDTAAVLKDGRIDKYIKKYHQNDDGDEKGIKLVRFSSTEFKRVAF